MAELKHLLRLSIFLRRNPSLTEEEFNKAWSEGHAVLMQQWLSKHGIIRYQQYHTPSCLRDIIQSQFPSASGTSSLPYDGVTELLLPSIDHFLYARQDPFYADKVKPSEENLFDIGSFEWTVGWEEVYVRDGRVVNLPYGDAGRGHDSHYVDDPKAHQGDEGVGVEWHGERI